LNLGAVRITALVRSGVARTELFPDIVIVANDILVVYGDPKDSQRLERLIVGTQRG